MDYDEAISYSQKHNTPLLVFFTEEDNDYISEKLVKNILKDPQFKTQIASKYTVLHLDFSAEFFQKTVAPDNATEKQQEEANTYTIIMQNNYTLSVFFNINERPGVFLCTKEGYVVDRLEDLENVSTLSDFKNLLDSENAKLEKINSFLKDSKRGSNVSKVEAIHSVLIATASEYRAFLLPLINYALELDPENKSGLCGTFIHSQADIEAMSLYSQGDLDGAVQKYLTAANNEFVKVEEKQECLYTAAYLAVYNGSTDYEGIVSLLQIALEIAPQSSKAESIQKAIDFFENKSEE